MLALVVAAGSVAFLQRQSARRDARVALAARLGAQAVAEPRLDRALLLAREAVRLDDTADTRQALLTTLLRSPALARLVRRSRRDAALSRHRLARRPDAGRRRQRRRAPPLRHDTRDRDRQPASERVRLPAAAYTPDGIEARRRRRPPARTGGARRRDARARSGRLPLDRSFDPDKAGAVAPLAVDAERRVLRVRPGHRPAGRRGPGVPRPARPRDRRPAGRFGSAHRTSSAPASSHGRLVTVTSRLIETWDPRTLRRIARGARPDPARGLRGRRSHRSVRDRDRALRQHDRVRRPPHRARDSCDGLGRPSGALAVAFSPDGGRPRRPAPTVGSRCGTRAPAARSTRSPASRRRERVAFSPDGRTLYASSLDGTVLAWAVDPAAVSAPRFACRRNPPRCRTSRKRRRSRSRQRGCRPRRRRTRRLRPAAAPNLSTRSRIVRRARHGARHRRRVYSRSDASNGRRRALVGRAVAATPRRTADERAVARVLPFANAARRARHADARDLEHRDRRDRRRGGRCPARPPRSPSRPTEASRDRTRRRPRPRRETRRRERHDAPPARLAERLARVPPGRNAPQRLLRRHARALGRRHGRSLRRRPLQRPRRRRSSSSPAVARCSPRA